MLQITDSPQHVLLNMLSEEGNTCSVSDAVGVANSQHTLNCGFVNITSFKKATVSDSLEVDSL